MLTIFSTLKPFRGDAARVQPIAIASWLRLRPRCEIILLGSDEGTAEAALRFGVAHVERLDTNEFGTPLLSSFFPSAEQAASNALLCYVAGDMVLLDDFIPAVRRVSERFRSFLMIGRRCDVGVPVAPDFNSGWEAEVRRIAARAGRLHPPTGLDYFLFPRGFWPPLPPFPVGRPAWDQWLVYNARSRGLPVVDATAAVMAVHQNHDVSYPGGSRALWEGEEARRSLALMGGLRNSFTTRDANFALGPGGIRRRLLPRDLRRSLLLPIILLPVVQRCIHPRRTRRFQWYW